MYLRPPVPCTPFQPSQNLNKKKCSIANQEFNKFYSVHNLHNITLQGFSKIALFRYTGLIFLNSAKRVLSPLRLCHICIPNVTYSSLHLLPRIRRHVCTYVREGAYCRTDRRKQPINPGENLIKLPVTGC